MRYLFFICFFCMISISAFSQEFKYHTVKKGETVYSISKDYDISEEDIYKYNPDAKNGIEVSSKLVIPIAERDKGMPAKVGRSSLEPVEFKQHEVKKKETLYSLSQQYNVEVEAIKRYNKQLYSKELQKGETIRIPVFRKIDRVVAKPGNSSKEEIRQKFDENEIREHVVLPKETKYGIARKYGLTVKELEALNPTVDVLQPGIMLKVGTNVSPEPVVLLDKKFEFYEVKPQETLFGLAQRFHVTQDSILALNPIIEKEGLEWGMVLKVPNPEEQDPDNWVEPTLTSEAEELQGKKINLKDSLSNFSPKNLVFMLPYSLDKIRRDSTNSYKDAILDDRVLRISLDFYSGAKMAIEDAKELGISTNVKVYDTKRSASEVANTINTNDFSNVDAVIGPFLQATTEAAAQRLKRENIPVFTPLSDKEMQGGNNLFIARPTKETMENTMIDYLRKFGQDKNIVIVADANAYQTRNRLNQIFPSARIINASNGYVSEAELKKVLPQTAQNWVILESSSVGVISSTVSALNRLLRDELNITLFTTNKSDSYDNESISNTDLGKLYFHYPSLDKEYDPELSIEFLEKYKDEFGVTPNQYAVRGYDLTMDVLLRLAASNDIYSSFKDFKVFTEYNENKFLYEPQPGGGFRNKAVYILQINPDLTLQIADDSKSNILREFKD
ncbi:PBP1 and LysM peptidoglycan-binding domain-containing protein [Zunongwangia sp. HRR-M8]|uniref:PBP1 and LysM peptidoglycan-binding domain-containing protein n=1 Tax=Zunongwangia sp. HRR-M8 TaxID=3015170 RepID=UPI0022DE411A|nr:LysM peptidoglycan-binding domain-containing protein [Zunongwangia sp. HRR-M8]WBL23436.1 LysM peptidoglycan-binding domain-containing protein [Zunongwangia sp. HRR-M8]